MDRLRLAMHTTARRGRSLVNISTSFLINELTAQDTMEKFGFLVPLPFTAAANIESWSAILLRKV